MRLLVVEDNEVNRKVAVKMLSKLGYLVDVVSNGKAAVDAMQAGEYDMVFMDCLMPELDGFEATRRIRSMEQCRSSGEVTQESDHPGLHTPIVAMTANVREEDKDKCFAAGMDDFIRKPVTLDALSAATEKWLKRKDS